MKMKNQNNMKHSIVKVVFGSLLTFVLLVSINAQAQNKHYKTQRKKANRSLVEKNRTNEIINNISKVISKLSSDCPIHNSETNGYQIDSLSFTKNHIKIVYSYTKDYMKSVDRFETNYDFLDYYFRLWVLSLIKSLGVTAKEFAKTGISFESSLKDNYGKVLWHQTLNNKEYLSFSDEMAKTDSSPGEKVSIDMEFVRKMVESLNDKAPFTVEYGVVFKKVSLEDKTICFYYEISSELALAFYKLEQSDYEAFYMDMLNSAIDYYYNSFVKYNYSIYKQMESLGLSLKNIYNTKTSSYPVFVLLVPMSLLFKDSSVFSND